jgi:hypothetical protein
MRYTLLVGVLCGLSIAHGVNEGVRYAAPVTHITATAAAMDWWEWLWGRPIVRTKRIDASTRGDM